MTLRRAAKSLFIRGKIKIIEVTQVSQVRTEDAVVKAATYILKS